MRLVEGLAEEPPIRALLDDMPATRMLLGLNNPLRIKSRYRLHRYTCAHIMVMHSQVPQAFVPHAFVQHTSFSSAGVGTNTRQPDRFVVGAKCFATPTSVACAGIRTPQAHISHIKPTSASPTPSTRERGFDHN